MFSFYKALTSPYGFKYVNIYYVCVYIYIYIYNVGIYVCVYMYTDIYIYTHINEVASCILFLNRGPF